jgi:hypothetical protein
MARIRKSGPVGVLRPFHPAIGVHDPTEQIADALDHIAVALSMIDHNLEVLTKAVQKLAK